MRGRLRGVAVSNSSVQLAKRDPYRSSITFSVADSTVASACVIHDLDAATTSNGFPLSVAQTLTLEGEIATHEFFAIRLAALDCLVGVIEGRPDGQPYEDDDLTSGIPTLSVQL